MDAASGWGGRGGDCGSEDCDWDGVRCPSTDPLAIPVLAPPAGFMIAFAYRVAADCERARVFGVNESPMERDLRTLLDEGDGVFSLFRRLSRPVAVS